MSDATEPARPSGRSSAELRRATLSDVETTPVVDEETIPVSDDGDHDRYAHIVIKSDLEASRTTGRPVRALCGKIWTPERDPSRYPLCPTCRDIAFKMKGGAR